MKTVNRYLKSAILSLAVALPASSALAAVPDPTAASTQAEYLRLRNAAVAFADTIGRIADRYQSLKTADINQARQLIEQSDQAAQQQDYAAASTHARTAYEMLRTTITTAVAQAGKPAGTN